MRPSIETGWIKQNWWNHLNTNADIFNLHTCDERFGRKSMCSACVWYECGTRLQVSTEKETYAMSIQQCGTHKRHVTQPLDTISWCMCYYCEEHLYANQTQLPGDFLPISHTQRHYCTFTAIYIHRRHICRVCWAPNAVRCGRMWNKKRHSGSTGVCVGCDDAE